MKQAAKSYSKIFQPLKVGAVELSNRLLMAPLTRARTPTSVPGKLQELYYGQRASAGLIITEATNISKVAEGCALTPGIYTKEQEAGWKGVVDTVHQKKGKIALQLWHNGSISHEKFQPNGDKPVSSSPVQLDAKVFVQLDDGSYGQLPSAVPRELKLEEIPKVVEEFRQAAKRARQAGVDLIEIHGANGYLVHQFLATSTNKRTDKYGGSSENRARFAIEVVDAIASEIGADRVGIRLSPFMQLYGMTDTEAEKTIYYLAEQFNKRGIAYVHINEPGYVGEEGDGFRTGLRKRFSNGALFYCGSYDADRAEALIEKGFGDAAVFGRPYIANPDLVERFRQNAKVNTPDPNTFYGGAEKGYTDYPTLKEEKTG